MSRNTFFESSSEIANVGKQGRMFNPNVANLFDTDAVNKSILEKLR